MKLRNKKTGEIVEFDSVGFRKGLSDGWKDFIPKGNSLSELNEEWEDYKPAEPLIKDEKIRKAVRAWAEAEDIKVESIYYEGNGEFGFINHASIGFSLYVDDHRFDDLWKGHYYTIAELCGEEEECVV